MNTAISQACFLGSCGGSAEKTGSRIGGPVVLPAAIQHPCDRSGKPLVLVAQVNFSDLQESDLSRPAKGLFLLFWNSAQDSSNPKDRHAFRCVWIANPDESELTESNFPHASINAAGIGLSFQAGLSLPQCTSDLQLFGLAGENLDQLQEMAAFAGNGVSWSPARRVDSCFSHLVDASRDWRLFARIRSNPSAGLDSGARCLYLLIRDEDLKSQNYDKCWLLVG